VLAQVGAPREVLAQQTVGDLVAAALPGTVRVAEVHVEAGVDAQLGVLAISAPWSQVSDRRNCPGRVVIEDAIASRTASAPCPASGGPFLTLSSPWHSMGGGVQQHREPGGAPIAELSSPRIRSPSQCPGTARSSASAGRSLIRILGVTNIFPPPASAGPRHAQRPTGPQARGHLPTQRAAALDVERLVERLVRDADRLIIGEVDR
jgi:hypothetical protein